MGERLDAMSVAHEVHPTIVTLVPRPSRNLRNLITTAPRLTRLKTLAREISEFDPDILHLNYEGLVPLLWLLARKKMRAKIVLHMRYMMPVSAFSRLYARYINRYVSHIIFISENERDRAQANGVELDRVDHTVLYNTSDTELLEAERREPDPSKPLRICFFGTIDEIRAPDRLIGLAAELRHREVAVTFDVYGKAPRNKKFLLFPRRNVERLKSIAAAEGVADMVRFHGHVSNPEEHLLASDLAIRPSRWNDPWGRDVIEALSAGVPVLSHGTYDKFVISGRTGQLFRDWDVEGYAGAIQALDEDREKLKTLSEGARDHARLLFDPKNYANKIMSIYERLGSSVAG